MAPSGLYLRPDNGLQVLGSAFLRGKLPGIIASKVLRAADVEARGGTWNNGHIPAAHGGGEKPEGKGKQVYIEKALEKRDSSQ